MRVHQSQAAETVQPRSPVAQDAPATPFASVLAQTSDTAKAGALPKGPKGEATRAVPNHAYVEITSGPRNGMFINASDNGRRGETFVLKKKADHDLHIYGSGKDRQVIRVPHAHAKPETTAPVEHHPAYDEITSGRRNGMFVNRTSNERSGQAFVLVKKDDRDLHIYGTGHDRRVIISWHKDQPAHQDDTKAGPAKDAQPVAEAETGGTTAPKSGA